MVRVDWATSYYLNQLEQLERLRSEDTPRRLMITQIFYFSHKLNTRHTL